MRRACDLEVLGRRRESLAALRAAPIVAESSQFPAICKEADFFLCLYLARNGETPPQALLDAIPDDHFGFDPAREMVTKKDIFDAMAAHAGPG